MSQNCYVWLLKVLWWTDLLESQTLCKIFLRPILTMAIVGPMHGTIPAAIHCDHCNLPLLVWDCFRCGGRFCGVCIFNHLTDDWRDVQITLDDYAAGRADPNEFSEGMHLLEKRVFSKVGSRVAVDPALAATREKHLSCP